MELFTEEELEAIDRLPNEERIQRLEKKLQKAGDTESLKRDISREIFLYRAESLARKKWFQRDTNEKKADQEIQNAATQLFDLLRKKGYPEGSDILPLPCAGLFDNPATQDPLILEELTNIKKQHSFMGQLKSLTTTHREHEHRYRYGGCYKQTQGVPLFPILCARLNRDLKKVPNRFQVMLEIIKAYEIKNKALEGVDPLAFLRKSTERGEVWMSNHPEYRALLSINITERGLEIAQMG